MVPKDAYYFSHDAGARHDPKISAMRTKYGTEGYGRYWILVELLREQAAYKLDCSKPYTWAALAQQLGCDVEQAQVFVEDCTHLFELFATDGEYFWSESLLRRMRKSEDLRDKRREAGRRSAKSRVSQDPGEQVLNKCSAHVEQVPSKCSASVEQNPTKERKGKGKVNETKGKKTYAPVVTLTQEEHAKLVERFGDADAADRIQALSLYKRSKGKQYRSDYATILSWARRDAKERPAPELPTHAVRDLSAPRDWSSANEG